MRCAESGARWAAGLAALLMAGVALGGESLPRLPADRALAQGDGSPGRVTFSHSAHVDLAKPSCLGCHPRPFKMLAPRSGEKRAAIRHEEMLAGEACGACHGEAKEAFGFDSCEACHQ